VKFIHSPYIFTKVVCKTEPWPFDLQTLCYQSDVFQVVTDDQPVLDPSKRSLTEQLEERIAVLLKLFRPDTAEG
jgi:hypothetical protein